MGVEETNILKRIQVEASRLGWRLFRNNVGRFWQGEPQKSPPGYIVLKNPRRVHSGLGKDTSDLIGWKPITITSEMVGMTVAVFTAIEVKTKVGRATRGQQSFLDIVNSHGGFAKIARSTEDLTNLGSDGRDG